MARPKLKIVTQEKKEEEVKSPLGLMLEIKALEECIEKYKLKVVDLKTTLQLYLAVTNTITTEAGKVSMVQRHTFNAADIDNVEEAFVLIEKKLNSTKLNAHFELYQKLPKGVEQKVSEYMTIKWNKEKDENKV